MYLIEDCSFSRDDLLLIGPSILHFHFGSQNERQSFIIQLIRLIDAWFGSNSQYRSLQNRQLLQAHWVISIDWATPKSDFLIEASCCNDELTMTAICCIRVDLGAVNIARVHKRSSAQQELGVVLCVVQIVTDLFIFLVKTPDFGTTITLNIDQISQF